MMTTQKKKQRKKKPHQKLKELKMAKIYYQLKNSGLIMLDTEIIMKRI